MNSFIRINGQPIYWTKWIDQGILLINDLFKGNGECKSLQEMLADYGQINWLEWRSIMDVVPESWYFQMEDTVMGKLIKPLHDIFSEKDKCSRLAYDRIIEDPDWILKYGQGWKETISDLEPDEYCSSFLRLYKCCGITKLRDFQYRLLLNKLVYEEDLYKWGKSENPYCFQCRQHRENAKHIFWECCVVKAFWLELAVRCNQMDMDLDLSFKP